MFANPDGLTSLVRAFGALVYCVCCLGADVGCHFGCSVCRDDGDVWQERKYIVLLQDIVLCPSLEFDSNLVLGRLVLAHYEPQEIATCPAVPAVDPVAIVFQLFMVLVIAEAI